jgi:hypothetical protein
LAKVRMGCGAPTWRRLLGDLGGSRLVSDFHVKQSTLHFVGRFED